MKVNFNDIHKTKFNFILLNYQILTLIAILNDGWIDDVYDSNSEEDFWFISKFSYVIINDQKIYFYRYDKTPWNNVL